MRAMRIKKFNPMARAVGIMAAVAIVVGGVTFAALQAESDIIQGNTIETATADLKISLNDQDYSSDIPGFDFNNLFPGGAAIPTNGYSFYLKNGGSTALALNMNMINPPTNNNNIDLSKLNVIVTPDTGAPVSFKMQDLMTNTGVDLNDVIKDHDAHLFKIQVSMDGDAWTSQDGSAMSNIDFYINGTAVDS